MDLRPQTIVERFRGKAFRYIAVSLFGTISTQILLWFTHGRLGWSGIAANLFSVTVTSIPCYFLSRYWIWGKNDKNRFWGEVVPFWGLTLAGLVLSTAFVALATHWSDSTIVVSLANLAGFGVLWIAKFVILDEVLFNTQTPAEAH